MGLIRSIVELIRHLAGYFHAREQNVRFHTMLELAEEEDKLVRQIGDMVSSSSAPDESELMFLKRRLNKVRGLLGFLNPPEAVHGAGGDDPVGR